MDIRKNMWLLQHECHDGCESIIDCHSYWHSAGIVEADSLEHPQGPLYVLHTNVRSSNSNEEKLELLNFLEDAPNMFLILKALCDPLQQTTLKGYIEALREGRKLVLKYEE